MGWREAGCRVGNEQISASMLVIYHSQRALPHDGVIIAMRGSQIHRKFFEYLFYLHAYFTNAKAHLYAKGGMESQKLQSAKKLFSERLTRAQRSDQKV